MAALTRTWIPLEPATPGVEMPFATLQPETFQGYNIRDVLWVPETTHEVLQAIKDIDDFRDFWNKYKYAENLVALIAKEIELRRSSPITNIVCLGISGANHDDTTGQGKLNKRRTCLQMVMFLQVVGQLIEADPSLRGNVVVQDPQMTPVYREVFERYGCRVVGNNQAWGMIQQNTLLFALFLPIPEICTRLAAIPRNITDNLACFIGNDIHEAVEAHRIAAEEHGTASEFGSFTQLKAWERILAQIMKGYIIEEGPDGEPDFILTSQPVVPEDVRTNEMEQTLQNNENHPLSRPV